jgi:hypothetical protein
MDQTDTLTTSTSTSSTDYSASGSTAQPPGPPAAPAAPLPPPNQPLAVRAALWRAHALARMAPQAQTSTLASRAHELAASAAALRRDDSGGALVRAIHHAILHSSEWGAVGWEGRAGASGASAPTATAHTATKALRDRVGAGLNSSRGCMILLSYGGVAVDSAAVDSFVINIVHHVPFAGRVHNLQDLGDVPPDCHVVVDAFEDGLWAAIAPLPLGRACVNSISHAGTISYRS